MDVARQKRNFELLKALQPQDGGGDTRSAPVEEAALHTPQGRPVPPPGGVAAGRGAPSHKARGGGASTFGAAGSAANSWRPKAKAEVPLSRKDGPPAKKAETKKKKKKKKQQQQATQRVDL